MKPKVNLISVGEIVNTHGIKGEVKVRILTDYPERFKKDGVFLLEKNSQISELTVENVKPLKNFLIIKFYEIDDIDHAETFKGELLKIPLNQLKELDKDTYYIFDIIGMEVFTEEGLLLGNVKNIFQTGSNDVYLVAGQSKEYLIPALKQVVKNIDKEAQKITIKPLDGLLDL